MAKVVLTRRAFLVASLSFARARSQEAGGAHPLRVGLLAPTRTGQTPVRAAAYQVAGQAAVWGGLLAEGVLGDRAAEAGFSLKVLVSSVPNLDALERAARRLVRLEEVVALLGGFGPGAGKVLSQLAVEEGILFFNIGDPDPALRSAAPLTLHVEASLTMYLRAISALLKRIGARRPFLLYEEEALLALAQGILPSVLGASQQREGDSLYQEAFTKASALGADALVLLLDHIRQLDVLAAAQGYGFRGAVVGLPTSVGQTRVFYVAARNEAPAVPHYRPTLWEATLGQGPSRELNARFLGRFGQPMDPPAWAAYAAVRALLEGTLASGEAEPRKIREALAHLPLDLNKGRPLTFDARMQLKGVLYGIRINPRAERPEEVAALLEEEPVWEGW